MSEFLRDPSFWWPAATAVVFGGVAGLLLGLTGWQGWAMPTVAGAIASAAGLAGLFVGGAVYGRISEADWR